MAASVPQLLKTIIFTLGGTSYAEDVISVSVVPTEPPVKRVDTLDGVVHQSVGVTAWAVEGEAVIDWDSVRPGLAYYLNANKGTAVAYVVKDTTGAESTTKPKLTGTCTLNAIPYGGEGNEYATAKFSFPCTGDPTVDVTP